MTREELEKIERQIDIIVSYLLQKPTDYHLFGDTKVRLRALVEYQYKQGIRYGINKISEEYIDENGMCLGKYKSAEEVIKELDEEQDDRN